MPSPGRGITRLSKGRSRGPMLITGVVSRIAGSNPAAMPMVGMAKTVSGTNRVARLTAGMPNPVSGSSAATIPTVSMAGRVPGSSTGMPMDKIITGARGGIGMSMDRMITSASGVNLVLQPLREIAAATGNSRRPRWRSKIIPAILITG